ncbi:MAG: FtsX-like permease family protein [Planctomycetota bacterium]
MYKLTIALRYLVRRRIAYISIIAIAFGLMAMIVVNSVMDGFQLRIRESIYKVDGSLTVYLKDPDLRAAPGHYEQVKEQLAPLLAENGGPILAMSKRILHFALVATTAGANPFSPKRNKRDAFIRIIGIDPKLEAKVLPLDQLFGDVEDSDLRLPIGEGAPENPFFYKSPAGPISTDPGIILGLKLAQRLQVFRGDRVTLISGVLNADSLDDVKPTSERFVVTGAFKSGRFDYDNEFAFCEGVVLKDLLGLRNDCQHIVCRVDKQDEASQVKKAILAAQGGDDGPLKANTWEDRMKSYSDALKFEKLAMLIVLACIILVAGSSICGILYMVVLEKTRDIGILLSMGATGRGIIGIFLFYGGILGLIGSLVGTFLGVQVAANLNGILRFIEDQFGVQLFPPKVYEFDGLPTHFDSTQIAIYAVGTFAWCLVSSLFPALRAARLDPVKCLSYE